MTATNFLAACGITPSPSNQTNPPAQKTSTVIGPSDAQPVDVLPPAQPATQSAHQLFDFSEQWGQSIHSQPPTHDSMGALQHSSIPPEPAFYSNPAKGIYYSNRVVILTFHDMSATLQSRWNMPPAVFAADLQILQKDKFHVVSNQQFIGWLEHQNPVPDNAVLLTFDDGYASWYSETLPILLQNHMTGTFFNVVGFVDKSEPGFLTWPQVETLAHDGMAMEAHTYDLHYLVKTHRGNIPAFDTPVTKDGKILTPAHYYERDYQDFSRAKTVLQAHLGTVVNQFAWPYGWGNWTARQAALQSGYQFIFTTNPGLVAPWTNPLALPRIDAGYADTTPQQMVERILQVAGVQIPTGSTL